MLSIRWATPCLRSSFLDSLSLVSALEGVSDIVHILYNSQITLLIVCAMSHFTNDSNSKIFEKWSFFKCDEAKPVLEEYGFFLNGKI